MNEVIIAFFTIATIMALGFIGDAISKRVLLPNVIFLILLGILFGPVLNLFEHDSLMAAIPYVAPLVLTFVSFEAGMGLDIHEVIEYGKRTLILSIMGFIFSTVAVGSLLHFTLNIRWAYALLMASAWSGVNLTIVDSIYKFLAIKKETYTALTMIALTDDPLVIISTLTILRYIILKNMNFESLLISLISNLSTSFFIGTIIGITWLSILYYFKRGEYTYTFTLAAILLVYSLSEFLGGTGAIAVFIFGLILGNYHSIVIALKLDISIDELNVLNNLIKKFHSELTFMIRSFFFTFIGLIYIFTGYFVLFLGLAICALLHVTKYAATKIGTLRSPIASDLNIMGLIVGQGAASAAMSTLPLVYDLPQATTFASIAFNVILFNNITSIILPYLVTRLQKTRKQMNKI